MQDDWDVGGVEQFDWVRSVVTSESSRFDWQVDSETLEVDDNGEDDDGGNQVHDVGQVLSVEGFSEGPGFVGSGGE